MTAEPTDAEVPRARDLPALIFAGAVVVVGALNLLLPRNYFLFGFDYLSWLPAWFRVAWTLLAAGAIAAAARAGNRFRLPGWVVPALAVLAVVSLFVFRTRYPTLQGDGTMGGSPYFGERPSFAAYAAINGRLQSFLSYGLSRAIPSWLRLPFHNCRLNYDSAHENAWILLTLLCGIFVVVLVTAAVLRTRLSGTARAGLLLCALASAPFLNAYGHFDSYVVPIATIAVWLVLVFALVSPPPTRLVLLVPATAAALGLCIWAHPLLALLAGYSAIALALVLLDRRNLLVPTRWIIAAGVLYGFAPVFVGRGNKDFVNPELFGILPWLLHEKAMSLLCVALPPLLLAGTALLLDPQARAGRRPGPAFARILLISSALTVFTLWTGYGILDEFVYSLFGTLVLGAALLMVLVSSLDRRVLFYAGVFSLFLFVPRMILYSGDLQIPRFSHHLIRDRCSANRSCSPYRLAATMLPVDSERYRQRRLELFEKGFSDPLPHLMNFREENLTFYVAWALEFGAFEDGALQLQWMIDHSSDYLVPLWKNDNALFTTRYHNVAPRLSRDLAREMIKVRLQGNPNNEPLNAMMAYLDYLDRADPIRLVSSPGRPDGVVTGSAPVAPAGLW